MIRLPRIFLLPLLFAIVMPAHAAGLPDTGQDTCYNDTTADGVAASNPASIARDAGTHPRQDCRYGRDAAAAAGQLTKTGAGAKGFDYIKIANNGDTLGASATLGTNSTDWACTKDNITRLTWEVKTATNTDLRYSGHTYTWYSSDFSTNGYNAGTASGGTCSGGTGCDTEKFVADVNAAVLCGFSSGWRMPTRRELLTLVVFDGSSPAIASTYFINTNPLGFWSGSPYVPNETLAWYVDFDVGFTGAVSKLGGSYVRLVHGEPF